jgi:hypothetical protein
VAADEAGPAGNQNAHDIRSPQSDLQFTSSYRKEVEDF